MLRLTANDNEILFSVTDSGVGISEETKAKLFTKFVRGEGGALNAGGSGLGLYLAQEIVKAHKGKITIDSKGLDKGSTFSVVLPSK
jgi:signal transduction histidine kinase